MRPAPLLALCILPVMTLSACEPEADWTPPRYGLAPDSGVLASTSPSACRCDQMVGRAFRFTSMEVTEPNYPDSGADEIMRDLLNDIWYRDMLNHVLNIIFEIREVDAKEGHMAVHAGPAWRDGCALDGALECTGPYIIHRGYETEILFEEDEHCGLRTPEGWSTKVYFHPGPSEDAVLCAPHLALPNAIPIERLTARGMLSPGCTAIVDGHMEGCISYEDVARHICFCLDPDYDCPQEPLSQGATCATTCGASWLSFGDFIHDVAGLEPNCDMDGDGAMDAYRIAGTFEAQALGEGEYGP